MRLSRKDKKFLTLLVVTCLLVMAEYSVYAFDPVLPQERLNDIVQIGTITPTQFEELDEATIQIILERRDVQSLLRNHFELLGLYGETSAGLILKKPEDWSRLSEELALSGTTFQKVYDVWYREKIQNQPELLTGDTEQMEAFFEKHFSSTEENMLADGRVIGTDVNWATFAYEQGLPIAAGILLIMYQAWWRKRKEEESTEDWGGLKTIYSEIFEKDNKDFGHFYSAATSDNRIFSFSDWYPRLWEFLRIEKTKFEDETTFKSKAQELVSLVQSYVSSRQAKQKAEFEATFQSVLAELSKEEIQALSQGKFNIEHLPEFLEKEIIEVVMTEETVRLEDGWTQFSENLLTEKGLTDFFDEQLLIIEDRLLNHPEKVQEILAMVQENWEVKFKAERQVEIENITAQADALYNDLVRYAVYNYQYENVAKARNDFYLEKVKELDQILAPQKEVLTTVFAKYTDSFEEKKEVIDETVRQITYRQELVEDIDYITSVSELFPYEKEPTPPSPETVETVTQEFYERYKPVFEKEEEINYLNATLVAAKITYDVTIGAQKEECDALIESIKTKIVNVGNEIVELEKKMDPTKNTVIAHAEVYSEEIDRVFDKQLYELSEAHEKMKADIIASWTPSLSDPDYWTRVRAQDNMDGSIAYYQKKYDETRKQIKSYRTGSAFRKIACIKQVREQDRNDFNEKQKQARTNYLEKRKENPAKKRAIQYLMGLEDSKPISKFFEVQQATVLNSDTIQGEILSLREQLDQPSPYTAEIQEIEEQMATSLAYSFEEYLTRNGITNTSWVVKDDWLRSKENIGRHGDYWGQKYAAYANYIVRDFVGYDEGIVNTLRDAAMKAHQEAIDAYDGWQQFFKQHPLLHEENMNVLGARLGSLQREDAEYKEVIAEQIATLEKEVQVQTSSSFTSAQWLNKTVEERQKDTLTNVIVETEIKASLGEDITAVDPTELITHFSNVRESQLIIQQNNLEASVRTAKNPLAFDESVMVAPIVARMYFAETPEGIAQKSAYFDGITAGVSDGSLSMKDPVTYIRNDNGTYTAVYRDTGAVVGTEYAGITQTTIRTDSNGVAITAQPATVLDQVKVSLASKQVEVVSSAPEVIPVVATVEEIAETPEIIAEAEAIVERKREEVLNIEKIQELEKATILNYEEIFAVDSALEFGFGLFDGVKSEVKDLLSLLNPMTWIAIGQIALAFKQAKNQLLWALFTDPINLFNHLKETLPEGILVANNAINEMIESAKERIANADDREKGAVLAILLLNLLPIEKIGKAGKLTKWADDIVLAIRNFTPSPKLVGVNVGGGTTMIDDLIGGAQKYADDMGRAGGKMIDYRKVDDVIEETLRLEPGQMSTSQHWLNTDEVLEATENFLGKEYVKSGPHGYRSADGLRRFRMDPESFVGDNPHVHFELFDSPNATSSSIINHVKFIP
jgi:hypothetical protein